MVKTTTVYKSNLFTLLSTIQPSDRSVIMEDAFLRESPVQTVNIFCQCSFSAR